ncbi:PLP-dependent transferase [Ceraceosorus guamensis]|uniref:PLP-dependent transferase n=1 Tax=Ceraceosorus guamensis TaxID=1522189 RepID=A0A316W1Y8_9BASI|nr:PLP-dependent transferase [Ceraceosorus guamensis]PWN42783.1 PLP-dependent transferase [Ceraceosorus guamensis]
MLSEAALRRPPSAIRSLFPAELIPGMLSFLAGKPNPSTFPIDAISINVKPTPGAPEQSTQQISVSGKDLEAGMNYGPTAGIKGLNDWLVAFQTRIHGREMVQEQAHGKVKWRVTVGNGSQDLLTKTFTALVNPGDSILVESPVYTGILPQLTVAQAFMAPVQSDAEGMCPKSLLSVLSNWHTDEKTKSHPFPKFVYTVPTGANPAGTTASEQRKRDVLSVVRRFNVLLLEDDPYIFLSFEGLGQDPVTRKRVRSYWDLERDERDESDALGDGFVVRFDSFSKIIGGGLRLGFMTGPEALIDAVDLDSSSANLQPSGLAQAVIYRLLQHWGPEGLLRHVDSVASFYEARRDAFERHAQNILGTAGGKVAVAEWVTPVAGMFLWLKLKLPPSAASVQAGKPDQGDSFALITEKARAKGILAVPGIAFLPGSDADTPTPYVRVSFSILEEEYFAEALQRLRAVVEEAQDESK